MSFIKSRISAILLATALAVTAAAMFAVAPAQSLRADTSTNCDGGTALCEYHWSLDGEHWHYETNVEDPIGDPFPDSTANDCPLRNCDLR